MILVRVGKIDQHFTDADVAEFLGADPNEPVEWHELVPDLRAEEDFERIYQRDLLRKILECVKLSRREREALTLFLEGKTFNSVAREKGLSRQVFRQAFKSALYKLRKAAAELGELSQLLQECPPAQKQVGVGFRSGCNR